MHELSLNSLDGAPASRLMVSKDALLHTALGLTPETVVERLLRAAGEAARQRVWAHSSRHVGQPPWQSLPALAFKPINRIPAA